MRSQQLYECGGHIHGRGAQGSFGAGKFGDFCSHIPQGFLGELKRTGLSQVTSLLPVDRKLGEIQASVLQPVLPAT